MNHELLTKLGAELVAGSLTDDALLAQTSRPNAVTAIGAVAGMFSLFVGSIFLFGLDGSLPDLGAILPF